MSEFPSQNQDKFVLRLPDGMRDRIKAAAAANNRSMNSEIVARLEQSFRGDGVSEITEDGVEFRIQLSEGSERHIELENVRELAKLLKLAIKDGLEDSD